MAQSNDELPDNVFARVTELSEQGNALLDRGQSDEAITAWNAALQLLPEPRRKWDSAMWLHASIGDAYRLGGNNEKALVAFGEAAASADGYANAFVQFGIGATLFDLGRTEDSTDALLRAYMMEGDGIFEESDGRYLNHLRTKSLID